MNKFVITTDYTADLTEEFYAKTGIERLVLPFTMNGKEYDVRNTNLPYHDFYDNMRNGIIATTSQVSQFDAMEIFTKHLEQGEDILHICFTSGVSGSFANFAPTVKELKEKFPERKIIVLDSLCGAGCLGMMVDKANQLKEAGKTIDEIAAWIESSKLNFNHYFIVDDLSHLRRGGRLSGIELIFGTILGIKPILGLNNKGAILPAAKIRGQKKAFAEMQQMVINKIKLDENDYIVVGHGDNLELAKKFATPLEEALKKPIIYNNVNYLIGAHAGPDVIAVFFYGKPREEKN